MNWTTDTTYVTPPSHQMREGETHALAFEMAALVPEGGEITAQTAALRRVDTGEAVVGGTPNGAILNGTVITVLVTGLVAGESYRLEVGFTVGLNVWEEALLIECRL